MSLSLSLSLSLALNANAAATHSATPAEATPPSSAPSMRDPARGGVIYIARRGWHIDVGFDAADLKPPLDSLLPEFPGVRYLFFGFGDAHYLLAKHRNAPLLLAALWPGRGMLLATGLESSPDQAFGAAHVIALNVTRAQLQAAEDFVARSFGAGAGAGTVAGIGTDGTGAGAGIDAAGARIRPYARGPYDGSWYYDTGHRYSALHTCNTWAAEVLKAGGLRVHSVGVVFAGQLWSQARRLARGASVLSRCAVAHAACRQEQGGFVPS